MPSGLFPSDIRVTDDDRPVRSRPEREKRARPQRETSRLDAIINAFRQKQRERAARKPPPPPPPEPKSGNGGKRRPIKGRRSLLRRAISLIVTLGIWAGMALGAVLAYYAYDLPDLDSLTAVSRRPSITLVSADNRIIAAYGDVYGEPLELGEIARYLPLAVIATEDRRFYSHFGIDPVGFTRAMVVNIRAKRLVQGGSGITQQLAKNLFLTPERNLKRKIQELLLAFSLERKFTKDQILTLYLNRVYLGSGTWGADAAARRYFGISARDLNLYQSALLAGLLKAPSRFNPQNDPVLSRKRTAQVLANMVDFGAITEEQAQEALRTGPDTVRRIAHTGRYFADWVQDQASSYTGNDRDVVVYTTLDMGLQAKAEQALDSLLADAGAKSNVSQGAIVVMTPDGSIRAMVGGRDYAASQFNRAVQGRRQPGSSFKPIVYLTALEAGWSPDDLIQDSPIQQGQYRPDNYTHRYEGPISLRRALTISSNIAAVRLIQEVGVKRTAQTARRLGITSPLRADASLALGTSEVSPVELTAAFATFANDGYGVLPHGIAIITDPQGETLYRREGTGTGRIIAPNRLAAITDMMMSVVTQGTGRAAAIDRPIAGKTGTTQDYRDAWFVGFSADYICAVWLGNDDGAPMRKVTGGTLPARLWRDVMLAAHQGLPARPLPGLTPSTGDTPQARDSQPAEPNALESIWDGLVQMLGGEKTR